MGRLIDIGCRELVGATGQYADLRGLGTLAIKPASKTDRLFLLEGELAPAPYSWIGVNRPCGQRQIDAGRSAPSPQPVGQDPVDASPK